MSTSTDLAGRTIKGKRPVANTVPASGAPVSFFLRTEAEMDRSLQHSDDGSMQRSTQSFVEDEASIAASVADTSYGVQSLEDAMQVSNDTLSSLARSSSQESTGNGHRRRPGNPVHPKIFATGQRIVSSEYHPQYTQTGDSPMRSHARRTSLSSSTHLTPLNLSPHPDAPDTPRTNSIKSFRLSDEEASVTSETGSQAIHSSSSEEEQEVHNAVGSPEPQLVMPSITMPKRRPFTQRGRRMGQMRIMVVGACGLGKTSFIRNVFRLCEDIVHIDGITGSTTSASTSTSRSTGLQPTTVITELQASTKPLPAWWSDLENSRTWWRRKSFSDGVLERNLRLVDTPGIDSTEMADRVLKELDNVYGQALYVDNMTDSQLLNMLCGKGDSHLDAVLYLFEPEPKALTTDELRLLSELSLRTNLIPLIARSDTVDAETLATRKTSLSRDLVSANIDICSLKALDQAHDVPILHGGQDVHAVSSFIDDGDIMDASTLMASSYLPPLRPSELKAFIDALFEPETMERLRHQSTVKFLAWRRARLSRLSPRRLLNLPASDKQTTADTGSTREPGKALAPHGYSSYFRSTSPSSDESDLVYGPSPYTIPQHQPAEPSRQVHIAKWARDLRRSLRREGNWAEDVSTRPSKGRLGGDLAVIDPKDPLGILSMTQAFGRRGWFALQLVGSCGLLSAAIWWTARNWLELQAWIWPGQDYFAPLALPAPTRSWIDNFRVM